MLWGNQGGRKSSLHQGGGSENEEKWTNIQDVVNERMRWPCNEVQRVSNLTQREAPESADSGSTGLERDRELRVSDSSQVMLVSPVPAA